MEPTLDIIIKGCIKKDRKSQKKLFEMQYGKMLSVAMSYMKDNDSAEEVIQESFIKMFNKISDYNSSGNFSAWLRRIVVNTAIDKIRKEKPNFLSTDIELENSSLLVTHDDDFEFDNNVTSDYVIKCLQELPDSYRTVFNMRVLEGMSHQDISEKLNIVVGTSKSNYHRAKAIMQKKLVEYQNKELV